MGWCVHSKLRQFTNIPWFLPSSSTGHHIHEGKADRDCSIFPVCAYARIHVSKLPNSKEYIFDYQSPLWLSHSLDFSVMFLAVLLLNQPVSQLQYWPSLNGCDHWDDDCLTVFNKATDHGAFSSLIPNRVSSLKSVSFMEPPSYKIFQKEWIITMLKCYWII